MNPPTRRIEQEWGEFRRRFLARDIPATELVDLRRCFYGGVSFLMRLLRELDVDPEPGSEQRMVRDTIQELQEFARSMREEQDAE
jgi:hypothetical protein